MDDLQNKISALFSSPESMEQIRNLAQSLAGGSGQATAPPTTEQTPQQPVTDTRMLQLLSRAAGELSHPSEASSIIYALRPYLSADRASKIDKAMNIARMAKIAKNLIPEVGGEKNV